MEKIRKNRIKILLFDCALIFLISVYGVYAFFTSSSVPVENVFSADNILISLTETATNDGDKNVYTNTYKMVPGEDIDKDPTIVVPAKTMDCWIYVKLDKSTNFNDYLTFEVADGWNKLGNDYPNIYYKAVEKKESEQRFIVLKNNKVKLVDGVDEDMLNSITNPPVLTITAYSAQQAAFDNKPDLAWKTNFGEKEDN